MADYHRSGAVKGPPAMRSVTIKIPEKVHDTLTDQCRGTAITPAQTIEMLFMAAYAVRVGKAGDEEIETAIKRTIVLYGAAVDVGIIATMIGRSKAFVETVITLWKSEVGKAPA